MGDEFAQGVEWSHERALDWWLLERAEHRAIQALVRDLNALYRARGELHERDCESDGFQWIDCTDADASVIAYVRRAADTGRFIIAVCNFTPVPRQGYRVGVPAAGRYRELLNTDSALYGGGNIGNLGALSSEAVPAHGHAQSLALTLPPLATIVLAPE